MTKRLLDTSVLIAHWRRRSTKRSEQTASHAAAFAADLIEKVGSSAIATPVFIEFIAGFRSNQELKLAEAYLAEFEVIDRQDIPPSDWRDAIRLAKRVPKDRKPRQMGDCLLRAIATRLNYEVFTHDQGFPSK